MKTADERRTVRLSPDELRMVIRALVKEDELSLRDRLERRLRRIEWQQQRIEWQQEASS